MSMYLPGVCNIGPSEVRSKLALGFISVAIVLAFLGFTLYIPIPSYGKILLFFPIYLGMLCFIQAASSFCINLGIQGFMNMDRKAGTHHAKVEEMEFRVQDQGKAKLLLIVSLFVSIILTMIVVFVPF